MKKDERDMKMNTDTTRPQEQGNTEDSHANKTHLPRFSGPWEMKRLGELADIRNGATPSTQIGAYWNGPIPWCIPTDITATPGKYLLATERSITETGLASCAASLLPVGTLLLCSRATIGDVKIATFPVCTNQGFKPLVCKDNVSNEFLYYLLLTLKPQLIERATGSTFLEIGKRDLASIELPVPPESEQRAIAEVLSDVDGLIQSLDALIAKKRAIKQAAMQQLLTGKTRLPGFSGAWETKRLGELGEISGAGVDKKIRPTEMMVRLVNYLDVYRKTFLYSKDLVQEVSAKQYQIRHCSIKKGDIFFTPTSEVRDDIGRSAVAMETIPDGVYSYHVVRLRLNTNWDLRFRAYAFDTKNFYDQASLSCEGSGTRYVITLPKFRAITICFPPTTEEQTAIAAILSDMDAEIAALERRRDKTHAIKQGMMQELLTGRVRLVSNPERE